ncbi:Ig-like domain-containing protein [Pseudomonas sp. TE21394]
MLIAWFRRLLRRLAGAEARPASSHKALHPPRVDEADDNILDPKDVPASGATVRITAWEDPQLPQYLDRVDLTVADYSDYRVISSNWGNKDVVFYQVPKTLFEAAQGGELEISYTVTFAAGGTDTAKTILTILGGFDRAAQIDLTGSNYVSISGLPPVQVPERARLRREADWGSAPYQYTSSDPDIAQVDRYGEVTALANGTCQITATDNNQQAQTYTLTITGMRVVHFLSASTDWQGMQAACAAAGLVPVPLADLKRLWQGYYPDTGPVAEYAGWLDYPFWTADVLGAQTAWAYDLNGDDINANASSHDIETQLQALGLAT